MNVITKGEVIKMLAMKWIAPLKQKINQRKEDRDIQAMIRAGLLKKGPSRRSNFVTRYSVWKSN